MDKKILIVEDDVIIAESLKIKVNKCEGFHVNSVAYDLEDALNFLNEVLFDLVLLDINLGEGPNGFEVAKKLNEMNIPFIYLTSYSSKEILTEALALKPDGYIVKPVVMANLKTTLELVISRIQKNIFELRTGKTVQRFQFDEIIYILTVGNYIDIYTTKKKYTFKKSLKSILGSLNEDFIQVNRNTTININHITKFDSEVTLKNGKKFSVSRLYKEKIIKKIG